ncbi:hypothetical protein [Caballeronia sp. NK8]|uniref:hypothetical protein n=1 Tax=Caballeronia sp. NK8 TaxID=140098 RepID=UPI001BCF61DF|nr:hypothetical protein [Caballeronia sp. NK8]
MQTSWSRKKFALNVHVQNCEYSAAESDRLFKNGFVAIVTISLSSVAVPTFPRLTLSDDQGDGFDSELEALSEGVAAANRIVDDLLGSAVDRTQAIAL